METYLAHHGILGMKWGIRRYQTSDGILTEDGKVRYSRKMTARRKAAAKKAAQTRKKNAEVKLKENQGCLCGRSDLFGQQRETHGDMCAAVQYIHPVARGQHRSRSVEAVAETVRPCASVYRIADVCVQPRAF